MRILTIGTLLDLAIALAFIPVPETWKTDLQCVEMWSTLGISCVLCQPGDFRAVPNVDDQQPEF